MNVSLLLLALVPLSLLDSLLVESLESPVYGVAVGSMISQFTPELRKSHCFSVCSAWSEILSSIHVGTKTGKAPISM